MDPYGDVRSAGRPSIRSWTTARPIWCLAALGAFLGFAEPASPQGVCATPWTLNETLRIGSVSGAVTLNPVNALTLGPDGSIFVAQALTPSVAVFDRDGRPQRSVGRAGQGPGELFLSALALGWKGDTLWVTDPNAVHFFDAGGRESDQVRFSTVVAGESTTYLPHTLLADGTVVGHRRISGRSMERFYEASRLPLLRFSRTGQVLDTIVVVDRAADLIIEGLSDVPHPLGIAPGAAELPGVVVTPDGTAVVLVVTSPARRPASFDLVRIAISGDTLWQRRIPYTPRAVTREQEARLRTAFGRRMSGADGTRPFEVDATLIEQRRRRAEEAIRFPAFHPPVRQVVAGADGSVWLLREMRMDRADRWEVYDGMGRLEGAVEVREPSLRVLRASRDELWATTADELGVTYLHRYQVRRAC